MRGEGEEPGTFVLDELTEKDLLKRDEDERTLVHLVVAKGKRDDITKLLERFPAAVEQACKSCDDGEWTPLHSSVSAGHTEVAKLIMPLSDLDSRNSAACTALHYAASKGHLELAQALIASGAKLGLRDNSGATPLHRAVANNRQDVVKEILSKCGRSTKNATILDRKDKSGFTALHLAAYSGNMDIARQLIEAGADKGIQDVEEKLPVDYAVDENMKSILS